MALEFKPEMNLNVDQIECIEGKSEGEYTFIHKFTYTLNGEEKEVETSLTYQNCQGVDLEEFKKTLLPTIQKTVEISISYGLGDKATEFDMVLAGEKKHLKRLGDDGEIAKFGHTKKEVVEFKDMTDLLKERKGKVEARSKEGNQDKKKRYQKRLALMNKIEEIAGDPLSKPKILRKKGAAQGDKSKQENQPKPSGWSILNPLNWWRGSKNEEKPELDETDVEVTTLNPSGTKKNPKLSPKPPPNLPPKLTEVKVKTSSKSKPQTKPVYGFKGLSEDLTPPNLEKHLGEYMMQLKPTRLKACVLGIKQDAGEHLKNSTYWKKLSKQLEEAAFNLDLSEKEDVKKFNNILKSMYLSLLWAIQLNKKQSEDEEEVLQLLVRLCGYLGDDEGAYFWSRVRHPKNKDFADEFFLKYRYPAIEDVVDSSFIDDNKKVKEVTAPFLHDRQFIVVKIHGTGEECVISKGVHFQNNRARQFEEEKVTVYRYSDRDAEGTQIPAKKIYLATIKELHNSLEALKNHEKLNFD